MIELFVIHGGKQNFTQWDLDQFVTNPCMKEGDEVVFYNSHGATFVVTAFEQDGEILADVPNYLLQMEGNILVDLGQGLERHTECRTTFAVVAQDKPEGYDCQYNVPDRPVKTGGVSSWNDLTDKPEGMGYIEEGGIVEILAECQPEWNEDDNAFIVTENAPILEVGTTYVVNWNGVEYTCVGQDLSATLAGAVLVGNGTNMGLSGNEEPFALVSMSGVVMCVPWDGTTELTISIMGGGVTIHKLDSRCLPDGVGGPIDVYFTVDSDGNATTGQAYEEVFAKVDSCVVRAIITDGDAVFYAPMIGCEGVSGGSYMVFSCYYYIGANKARSILWQSDGTAIYYEL